MAKKLTLDLSVFKSSGVYTLEYDASDNIIVNPQTVRLVVGFSSKGPFNTPVYVPDQATAIKVFGDIDRTLEKKGSFFHRSMLTCLTSGPIFALNLLKLNNSVVEETGEPDVENGADVARYRAFSIDTVESNGVNFTTTYATNNSLLSNQDKLVSSYYNKERFWFPDPAMLLATTHTSEKSKLFSIVNLSQAEASVIVKKSLDSNSPLRGFDITASEYFGPNNVPIFMHPQDYISDFFIDVIAISGNWTNYLALSQDPVYSEYFTSKGFIKEKLDQFLALTEINMLFSVTGCLIPDFTDQNGVARYIKTLINTQVGQTGILCAVNEEALDDLGSNASMIDLVGHHLTGVLNPANDPITEIDFLSYTSPFSSDLTYEQKAVTVADNGTGNDLIEGGDFYQEVGATDPGITSLAFEAYDPNANDAGYPFLQTAFTGPTQDDRVSALQEYLTPTVNNPEPKYIIGKITTSIAGNVDAGKSFADDDLVKLKVESVKLVTVAPGNVQLRILWSHPLYTTSNQYVEPYNDTDLFAGFYQFGTPNYFNRLDPIETSPGLYGSPEPINPQINIFSYYGYAGSQIFKDYKNGLISDGDVIHTTYDGSTLQYIKLQLSVDRDGFDTISLSAYPTEELSGTNVDVANWNFSYKSTANGPSDTIGANKLNVISIVGNLNEYIDILSIIGPSQVEMSLIDVTSSGIKVGDLLVSQDLVSFENSNGIRTNRLTRINEVKRVPIPGSPGNYTIYVKTDRPILLFGGATPKVNRFKAIHDFISSYKFTYLPGFIMKASHRPNGTDNRLDEILDVLFDTNIANTLSDRNIITFRYIVDTFDGQIKTNSKSQLSRLARLRQKCLALLNAPSINKFKDSVDPRFTDAPTATNPSPLLNAKYIADGGNLSLNPSFRFTLPDEDLGAKFCGVFSPFLTIRDNGKNINIPPAAHVSNNFIRKFVTGEPYSIVAGQKRGILSGSNLVGLEYDFATVDRDYLEPFGINPIVRKRNIGLVIYGNQTSYQRTNSAFNNLHVRDLLITLEENIEDILANYVFDFNEDSVRLEIKTIVDNYLTGVKNVGGVYNYLTIMDSSNNTPAIIDQNIGIIDVIIEPARGIHKFINRMTVTRTGGISSGGFFQFS